MSSNNHRQITLNRETNEHTRRLKRSLNRVKWSSALMQIFWTAGPVTTIGLIGGYYIGYGTMPSTELLIYFVMFTVLSGFVGLIAKVVKDGTRGHLEERRKRDILNVTDKLSDLILIARDKITETYEGEARRREAALQLLRRVDLTPFGVTVAFTDLTDNKKVGEAMGQIYTYRRIGLQTRVEELCSEHHDLITKTIDDLKENSPQASSELRKWFIGNRSGKLKYGVPREKQFLQRIMSAIELNNPHVMTFRDVEEMLILAFELINGREIPTITFSYSGKWKYASVLDELEKSRSKFRVAQAKAGNRMRALSSYLIETGHADPEQMPEGIEISNLIDKITAVIDSMAQKADSLSRNTFSKSELQALARDLETAIELYSMAHNGSKESLKRFKDLKKTSADWKKMTTKLEASSTGLKIESGRRGIHINENVISLDEDAVLEVCRHLTWFFKKEDVQSKSTAIFSSLNYKEAMTARRLAIEIAVALEPHIGLSKPEIQRNINATKAIYLGSISPEMSAEQKKDLAEKMAHEVDNGLNIAAVRLAEALVKQYHVELTEGAIDFFVQNYNASRKTLENLAKSNIKHNTDSTIFNQLPPAVQAPKSIWKKQLQKLHRQIQKIT
ncbi:MAG: hypothetical protein ACQETF_11840 [Bacteroidota bacterium]